MKRFILFCLTITVHAHNITFNATHNGTNNIEPSKSNSHTNENGGWAVIIAFALFFLLAGWSTFVRAISYCSKEFWESLCCVKRKYGKTKQSSNNKISPTIQIVSV